MGNEIEITVNLELKTCRCGTVYAVPSWVTSYRCPTCADHIIETHWNARQKLERRISALKGTITRLQRQAGK